MLTPSRKFGNLIGNDYFRSALKKQSSLLNVDPLFSLMGRRFLFGLNYMDYSKQKTTNANIMLQIYSPNKY